MDLQGCDGSALLGASATRTIVDDVVKRRYLSLKAEAFSFIEVSGELGRKCGRVVSCADILSLAARDAVSINPVAVRWPLLTYSIGQTRRPKGGSNGGSTNQPAFRHRRPKLMT